MLQEMANVFSLYNLIINYLIVLSTIFIYAYFTKKHKGAKKLVRSMTCLHIVFLAFSFVTNHVNDKVLAGQAAFEAQKVEAQEYFDSRIQELSIYFITEVDFSEFRNSDFRRDNCIGTYGNIMYSSKYRGYTVNTKEDIDSCIIEILSNVNETDLDALIRIIRERPTPFFEVFGIEPQDVLNECSISKDCPEMLEIIAIKTIENIEIQREEIRLRLEEEAKEEAELRAYNEEQRIKAEQAKWEAERPQRMEAKIDAMIKREAEKQAENDELKAKIEKLEALLEVKEG